MKHLFTLLLVTFTSALLQPPDDGHFFYCGFRAGSEQIDQYYVDIFTGSDAKQELPIWISTDEYYTGIISNKCTDDVCKVPKKWDTTSAT